MGEAQQGEVPSKRKMSLAHARIRFIEIKEPPMSLPEGFHPLVRWINSQMSLNDNWRTRWPQRYPLWWGKMLTSIGVILGPDSEEEILYVTSDLDGEKFDLAVFTAKLVLLGSTTDATDDDAEYTLTSYRLDGITALGVTATANAFRDDYYRAWPGKLSVTISHPGFETLTLPLEKETDSQQAQALVAFTSTLASILNPR